MKLVSYELNGQAGFGAVVDGGVVALHGRLQNPRKSLRAVLASDGIPELRDLADRFGPDEDLAAVTLLPAIPNPNKILCLGINYRAHAVESGRDLPAKPSVFARFSDTLVGHGAALVRPQISDHFDFEGELAIVIGRGGRFIAAEVALDHVAGYTCFVDGSVRDYQKFSVTAGKNFPGTGPLGPWIVTTDAIPDPSRLTLVTRLNGQEVQRSGTDMLIHTVPEIVAYCSHFTELSPGDVIATGTPEGVGQSRNPQLWMTSGDELEVEISGIGILRNHVVDEPGR